MEVRAGTVAALLITGKFGKFLATSEQGLCGRSKVKPDQARKIKIIVERERKTYFLQLKGESFDKNGIKIL